jgi:uncharacterized protein YfaS (alpha-2-macroglobulin family)
MKKEEIKRGAVRIFKAVLGEFKWNPPQWGKSGANRAVAISGKSKRWVISHRTQVLFGVLGLVILSVGGAKGYHWYKNRPKPFYVSYEVHSPDLTPLKEDAVPDHASIEFSSSAAQLKDLKRSVNERIHVSPAVEGSWMWIDDKTLEFTPKKDWPIDQKYSVKFDTSFQTKPFSATLVDSKFYQDPIQPRIKSVVATVRFSHPVDGEDLKKRITLKMAGQKDGFLGIGKETYKFSVAFGKFNGEAYIHSDPIPIPERDSKMTVVVASGAKSMRGGNGTPSELKEEVNIPGMFNYFQVSSAELRLVPNEKFESDQVVVLSFSTDVDETELKNNVELYLLPKNRPRDPSLPEFHDVTDEDLKNFAWESSAQVTPLVISKSKAIALDSIPNEHASSSLYSFKVKVPVESYLAVKIKKGTKSLGDYVLSTDFQSVVKVPPFPPEVRVMHDGAILSLAGEKKLSILSRSMPGLRFEIGRVIPSQINHMITQTNGTFQRPQFSNYNFSEENIAEKFTETRSLAGEKEGRNQYSAFDFGRYLAGADGSGGPRKGLFFLRVEGWDPVQKQVIPGRQDTRFILVSDLGVLVKTAVDHSHEVYIQSIHSGRPVPGSKVDVLGKNGITLLSGTSDADGKVSFPTLEDYKAEKYPTAYVIRHDADISFLPYEGRDRSLNLTRFDIGGEVTTTQDGQLSAFVFSERGLYRPGDDFNVAMIVRSQDWRTPLAGIPVEAVVQDPRGVQIYREELQLPSEGFSQIHYRTEETSPTGNYPVSLYMIKTDEKGKHYRGDLLGSTTLRVEEFLPDTMKIFTHLSQERLDGWVSPDDLKALVNLKNLFGTAAEARKISASLALTPFYPSFRKYKDFTFFDPGRAKKTYSERLEDKETNDKGEAEYELDLKRFESATYRLVFLAEGFEAQGGRSVSAESSTLVSPLKFLIGYKADGTLGYIKKDSKRQVQLLAVDPSLAKTTVDHLTMELVELKTISVLTKQDDGTFQYQSVRRENSVKSEKLTLPKEGMTYALPSSQAGDFALVIHEDTADKDKSKVALARIEFTVTGESNIKQKLEKNAELKLRLSKADFAPGEDIEVQVTAPFTGSGLITIEREKVYAHKWFTSNTPTSVQKIRLPAGLEGNAYVSIAFVRSLDSPEIFTSPLSYGTIPFSISREKRNIPIELTVPDLVKPGNDLKIGYRSDKPSKIVVFAVDEGILQVADYKTPDPLAMFFKKRALEVTTDQLLDLILPEFSVVKKASGIGGDKGADALGKNLNPFKRKRDKPVVYWSGIIDSGPEQKELSYTVPEYYNGSIRVMAVAVSAEAVGTAEKKLTVRGDFVITPNAPLFMTPGDEAEIGVSLSNNVEQSGADAKVTLTLENSEHFKLGSEGKIELAVAEGHETSTVFKLKAEKILGSGTLIFKATLGKHQAKRSIDLSIRPANPYQITLQTGYARNEKKELDLSRKMDSHFRVKDMNISILPLTIGHGLFKFLTEYPYDCTEQLVSKAFPKMVLKSKPDFGVATTDVEKSFAETLRILSTRQNAEGGIGMWSAQSDPSNFYTTYAYHYLTEAKERGFAVPREMMKRIEGHLLTVLKVDPNSLATARMQAYSAYLLARNGIMANNEFLALQKYLQEHYANDWTTDLAGIYVASTYFLYKKDDEAQKIIRKVRLGESKVTDYENYYDPLVRDSQLLYLLSKHFPEMVRDLPTEQLEAALEPVLRGQYNSLSSSYAILALDTYADQIGGSAKVLDFTVSEMTADPKAPWHDLTVPAGLFPKLKVDPEAAKVKVANRSDFPVFYQTVQAGYDQDPPTAEIKQKIEAYRELQDDKGVVLTEAEIGKEYTVHTRVRSTGSGYFGNIAVVDLLPSGFEVVMERKPVVTPPSDDQAVDSEEGGNSESMDKADGDGDSDSPPPEPEGGEGFVPIPFKTFEWNPTEFFSSPSAWADESGGQNMPADRTNDSGSNWVPDYVDIREDRMVLYGTVQPTLQEYVYRVKAVNRGTFVVPPVFAESMYDRSVQARGLPGKIKVEGK